MLGTFLNTLSGFFDRRFFVVHWGPAFIGLGLAVGLGGIIVGPSTALIWWAVLGAVEQVLLGAATLLIATLLAYLLESLTVPLVRLYEGNIMPSGPLSRRSYAGQQKALQELLNELSAARPEKGTPTPDQQRDFAYAYHLRYHRFPRNPVFLRPTKLGNVLAAAEEYAYQIYQLDAVLWWPRLATLLPEAFRTQIDGALAPMLALLNLSTWLILWALGGGMAVLLASQQWWLFLSVFIGGLVLAQVCYQAAVSQAHDYGVLVRVAFDLYRYEILKQMKIPIPENPVEERKLWASLNAWHYYYTPTWEILKTPSLGARIKEFIKSLVKGGRS